MVITIILIILAVMFTMGMALPAVLVGMGLTYGALFFIGFAALAICFIISPEGASEGLKKAFDGVSSAVSGIVGGVTGIVSDSVNAVVDNFKIPSLLWILGGGFLAYKLFIEEDQQTIKLESQPNSISKGET